MNDYCICTTCDNKECITANCNQMTCDEENQACAYGMTYTDECSEYKKKGDKNE